MSSTEQAAPTAQPKPATDETPKKSSLPAWLAIAGFFLGLLIVRGVLLDGREELAFRILLRVITDGDTSRISWGDLLTSSFMVKFYMGALICALIGSFAGRAIVNKSLRK